MYMEDEALGLDEACAEALARGCARFVKFLGASKLDATAIREPRLAPVRMLFGRKYTKAFTERAREPQNVGIYTGLFCPIRLHTPFKHHMARCRLFLLQGSIFVCKRADSPNQRKTQTFWQSTRKQAQMWLCTYSYSHILDNMLLCQIEVHEMLPSII
jgi:hypothetical protein